ncbi:MAG: hypothetical protein ABEN55_12110 [Bradymonadaceae bacterium]
MAWTLDDIKKAFTDYINNDPEGRYTSSMNKPDTDPRSGTEPDEWDNVWHYFERAMKDVIEPELRTRYEATALHGGGQSIGSGTAILGLSSFLQRDSSVYNSATDAIEVTESGTYAISCAVSAQSNGGTINYRIYPEVSTDGGSTWSQIDTVQAFDFITADLEYGTASVPMFTYDLNANDLVRVIVDFFDGTGTSLETENGQLTLTKVGP